MTGRRLDLERTAWLAETQMNVTLEEFRRMFADWEMHPITAKGALMGVTIMRGPEIHVSILPQYLGRWVTRRFLKETLLKALGEYGLAVTQVFAANLEARRFVERLGFRPLGYTGEIIIYEATA